MDKVVICELCGRAPAVTSRWYKYDNGEQTLAPVCANCAALHSRLLKANK